MIAFHFPAFPEKAEVGLNMSISSDTGVRHKNFDLISDKLD